MANGRGWKHVALMTSALSSAVAPLPSDVRGSLVTNVDGSRSLVAPPRGQNRARRDTAHQMPDPFEAPTE
jgi:hypothetical protein